MPGSSLRVTAAFVSAGLLAVPRVEASPPSTPQLAATTGGDAVEATGATGAELTGGVATTDTTAASAATDTTTATDTTATTDSTAATDTTAAQELPEVGAQGPAPRAELYAMPVPTRRAVDKRLRRDRGLLAAGIVFAAVCGAGAGIGIWALARQRNQTYGTGTTDAVAAVTALLTCTVGGIALATTGAIRLKRRRSR